MKQSACLKVSCLVVLSLWLMSWGAETDAASEMVKMRLTKADGTVVERQLEKPKYGGVFAYGLSRDVQYWDESFGSIAWSRPLNLSNEDLVTGDWARGLSGTGEASWRYHLTPPPHLRTGCLAESWEIVDNQTVVYHIRRGVHFHDKPPTNGRELDAHDVVASYKHMWASPKSYLASSAPWDKNMEELTALDDRTVRMKVQPGKLGIIYPFISGLVKVVSRDVLEKYGDVKDWRNVCGTGPFILTDYVSESSVTLKRNPNYWRSDPLFSENKLPYLDEVKWLIIPDLSTRMAALRTGKIGLISELTWDDAKSLKQTNPELKWVGYPSSGSQGLMWYMDKPDLPFANMKVRRALCMAVDQTAVRDQLYGGNAELINYPVARVPEFSDIYVGLEDMDQAARELYEYHPEKAKQLLTEAGYPKGFKTTVLCYQAHVDVLSIVKGYFEAVGVDLEIEVKEYSAYYSQLVKKAAREIIYAGPSGTAPEKAYYTAPGSVGNYNNWVDQHVIDSYNAISEAYFDYPKMAGLIKETAKYILAQAHFLQMPQPHSFNFWQPWVKGYQGENMVGYGNFDDFPIYIWIDPDLK